MRGDNTPSSKAVGRNCLEIAMKTAAATDTRLIPIERYDLNSVTGLVNTIEERDIDIVVLGMHRKSNVIDTFFGSKLEQLQRLTNRMLVISRCYVPLNTVTRIVIYVPPQAQYETGFSQWVTTLATLSRELGCRIIFCCNEKARPIIRNVIHRSRIDTRDEYRTFDSYDEFVLLANRIADDDLFVVIMSRANSVSYSVATKDMPDFLQTYFANNNLIIIYPEQFGNEASIESFSDPLASEIGGTASPLWGRMRALARRAGEWKRRLTHRSTSSHTNKFDL